MPRIECTPVERSLVRALNAEHRLAREVGERMDADAAELEERAREIRAERARMLSESAAGATDAWAEIARAHGWERIPEGARWADPKGGPATVEWAEQPPTASEILDAAEKILGGSEGKADAAPAE